MRLTRKIAVICFFLTSFGFLSACGTVHGFGQDVSHVGHDIQKASH